MILRVYRNYGGFFVVYYYYYRARKIVRACAFVVFGLTDAAEPSPPPPPHVVVGPHTGRARSRKQRAEKHDKNIRAWYGFENTTSIVYEESSGPDPPPLLSISKVENCVR